MWLLHLTMCIPCAHRNFKFFFLVILNYQAIVHWYHVSEEYLACYRFCPCCDGFLSEVFWIKLESVANVSETLKLPPGFLV